MLSCNSKDPGKQGLDTSLTLTSTTICQFDRVRQVGCSVVALISVPGAVVPDKLGVNVDSRNIVNDAADLELCIFEQMSQQRRLA